METKSNPSKMGQSRERHQHGFSLVELMIVVSIIGIMSTIAFSSMVASYPNYKLKEAARDTLGQFQRARMEAAKRGINVSFVFNQPFVDPGPPIAVTTFDYVMFVDDDADGNYDINVVADDTDDELILARVRYADNYPHVIFTGVGTTFGANDDGLRAFTVTPRGLVKAPNGSMTSGTLSLTNTKGMIRNVVMSSAGRLTVRMP